MVKPFVWYILVVSETFSRDISLWFQKESDVQIDRAHLYIR